MCLLSEPWLRRVLWRVLVRNSLKLEIHQVQVQVQVYVHYLPPAFFSARVQSPLHTICWVSQAKRNGQQLKTHLYSLTKLIFITTVSKEQQRGCEPAPPWCFLDSSIFGPDQPISRVIPFQEHRSTLLRENSHSDFLLLWHSLTFLKLAFVLFSLIW